MNTNSNQPGTRLGMWSSSTTDPRVRRVEFLLQCNLERKLHLCELASATGFSVSRLSQFKGRTGTTPARYIKSAKMEKAKELLETSFLGVKEIAYRVGQGDVSHLVRNFERWRPDTSPISAAMLEGSWFYRFSAKSATK